MSDQNTRRLGLPLVQAAQAQKHVTVNESLARLDGMVNLTLLSLGQISPPLAVIDGCSYGVPVGAEGDWRGEDGRIAIASNGGWVFADPQAGMRAFVADLGTQVIHDGVDWVKGALTLGRFGSGLVAQVAEAEVTISAGASVNTGLFIPYAAMVIGVTARVTEAIEGSLASWRLGTEGALDRFGSALGIQHGSWARGMLSQPVTYWAPAPLILSATGGEFASGKVRLVVHWLELTLPS